MSSELLAYLPFGERKVKKQDQATWRKAVEACQKDPSKWPQQVPSFELWAAATKYERGKPDGGPAFRTMMRLLLVEGNSLPVNIAAKPHVPKAASEEWKTKDANTHKNNNDTQHTPSTQGKLSTVDGGLPNGALSSKGTGFVFEQYNEQQGQITIAADGYESRASIKPLTKLAWAKFCMGLADPKHGTNTSASAGKHGSHTSFSSAHKAKTKKNASCDEVEGECLSLGNQLASIFGLYYYDGCEDAENNWMVKQTLGSKVYYVRMRAWNPAYTMKQDIDGVSRLLVQQPLNTTAQEEEGENQLAPQIQDLPQEKRFVGSHEARRGKMMPGFWLPTVMKYDGHPLQPSHVICQSHKTGATESISTALAPWFGKLEAKKPADHTYAVRRSVSKADPEGDLAAKLRELLGDLVMEKTKGDDGISLGFVAPKAHWLYPHHDTKSKLECESGDEPGNSLLQGANAYQPCPQWHSRYGNTLKAGCMVPDGEESLRAIKQNGLYYVTDLFKKERERLNQIRYALGDNRLPFDEKAAKAVDAMIAKRRPGGEVPDEDLGDLPVDVLRAMAQERGIETKTGKVTKAGPQYFRRPEILRRLRAQKPPAAAVVPAAKGPAEAESDEEESDEAESDEAEPDEEEPATASAPSRGQRYAARQRGAVEEPKQPKAVEARTQAESGRGQRYAARQPKAVEARTQAESGRGQRYAARQPKAVEARTQAESGRSLRSAARQPKAVAREQPSEAPKANDTGADDDAMDEEDPEDRDAQRHEFITEDTANTRPAEFEYADFNQEVIVVLENETLNDMETGDENTTPTETTDERFRFESQSEQAWPHSELYETPSIVIVANDLSSVEGLKQYKQKYGSTANLYVGGRKIASDLLDPTAKVKMQYGYAHLDVMKSKLFHCDRAHKEQMLRILRIYADQGRFGRQRSNLDLSAEEKRDGFNFGVALGAGCKRKAPCLECLKEKCNPQKRVLLWKPVFGTPPTDALCKAIRDDTVGLQTKLFLDWYNKREHRANGCMTVQEWLCTPWHYNSLPLERHAVMFRDGECYSEGCRRCARPFFEYEWRYAWTRLSVPGTAGFTQRLWRPDGTFNRAERAPRPFDDPCFWEKAEASKERNAKRTSTKPVALAKDAPRDVGGEDAQKQMNWELYAFQYGPPGFVQNKSALSHEWNERNKKKAEAQVKEAAKKGFEVVYRQYNNHCYSAERARDWDKIENKGYPTSVACRAAGPTARVQAGAQDYRLARCAKYGNLCVDCAATLYAAKMLDRSHESSKYAAKSVGGRRKKKEKRSAAQVLSEWQTRLRPLKTATGEWAKDVLTLSPADMRQLKEVYKITEKNTTRKDYSPEEEAQMRQQSKQAGNAAVALARERQAKPLMQHLEFNKGEVQCRTMYKTPPEFYIQNHFPWRGMEKDKTVPKDRDDILEALKLLDRMLAKPELDAAKPKGKRTSLAPSTFWTDAEQATAREQAAHNVALQHMLAELHRRYVHMETHTEAPVERFDMNWRKELRNEQVADPRPNNKTVWENCLVVCTPQPEMGDETEAQGKKKRKYTTEKVYYNSFNKTPADGELETMWRGDKHVIHHGGPPVQWRERRQSRLFITYSLHRAITGEDEGRFILARMAAACDYVFGNETELAKLLVFGYKVSGPPKRGREGKASTQSVPDTDAISRGSLDVIQGFRKQDKQFRFYGRGQSGS